jgi:type 1 glutamine amidotransferase
MESPEPNPLRIFVYSRTVGFRHDTIEPGQKVIAEIAARHKATVASTDDPAQLVAALAQTDVVVFLMTTGDVLDDAQQTQLESFIRNGGGFVGVHSAADTEYDWPFYETLNGAWFADHPAIQPATLVRESADHPAVSFLPATWQRTDEWYNFRTNPRAKVQVLLRLDEASYQGGTMGDDHPIVWAHTIDRGRAFYTGLGHTQESWQEPLFLQHIEAALLWAGGVHPQP